MNQITERLPPSIPDSLVSYSIIPDSSELNRFFTPVLESYVSAATSAPPEYTPALTASRPEGCEICGREQLQLTYHHLIPRQVWAKAVKRDWCKEWQLQKVCWLVSFLVLVPVSVSTPVRWPFGCPWKSSCPDDHGDADGARYVNSAELAIRTSIVSLRMRNWRRSIMMWSSFCKGRISRSGRRGLEG